ncbi:hypothetical protein [Candidatus Nanohalococcus occultus]|uniref:Membrane protein n=1 Tax=Candidatus Nanohalococcus occultus TaxID=2978047 RepID=A0ABY8CDW9_9ARCH|nr:putative membrane protein [Candidatus Nanohaloarchaeota archaeon SVXNc]
MSKKTLSRIDPVSLGKWSALVSTVFSLATLLIYVPFLFIGLSTVDVALTGLLAAIVGGIFFVAFLIAVYAGMGFVMGVVIGHVYNWFAGRFGGLKLEFEDW